jgi:hypothetical protein
MVAATGIALRFFTPSCSKELSARDLVSRPDIRFAHLATGSTPIDNHEKIPQSVGFLHGSSDWNTRV